MNIKFHLALMFVSALSGIAGAIFHPLVLMFVVFLPINPLVALTWIVLVFAFGFFVYIMLFIYAFPFAYVACLIAYKLNLRSNWYFGIAGAAITFLAIWSFVIVSGGEPKLPIDLTKELPDAVKDSASKLWLIVPSGIAAGLALGYGYRRVLQRFGLMTTNQ